MLLTTFFNSLLVFPPILARLLAFFVLSPLFSKHEIPSYVRFGLAVCFTMLLAPTIQVSHHPTVMLIIRELVLGYLMGFLFALIFEGVQLAGQVVGVLSGFSATELIDPQENSAHPLITKVFVMTLFTVMIAMDGHHLMLRFLYDSFALIPLHAPEPQTFLTIALLSSELFRYALDFALIPLTFLGAVIITFAFSARFLPQLQIFWIGFPIQLLISFLAIGVSLTLFPTSLSQLLNAILEQLKRIFFAF